MRQDDRVETSGNGRLAPEQLASRRVTNLEAANRELRDVIHALLPRSLSCGGLGTGLESLVSGLDLPVEVRVEAPRLPAAVETTAYLVVAEALTNTVRHARATRAQLQVELASDGLVVEVRDDGLGGADPILGMGLTSLSDRVEAIGGSLEIVSPPGQGTTVRAELPVG